MCGFVPFLRLTLIGSTTSIRRAGVRGGSFANSILTREPSDLMSLAILNPVTSRMRSLRKALNRVFGIPEECNNPSRWLSSGLAGRYHRYVIGFTTDPGRGSHRGGIPAGILFVYDCFRWCRPGGLNHRLGLLQASGLQKASRSTFAEVSSGTLDRCIALPHFGKTFIRPAGTEPSFSGYPAINRRAILVCPSGTS